MEKTMAAITPVIHKGGSTFSINGKTYTVPENCEVVIYSPPNDGRAWHGELLVEVRENGQVQQHIKRIAEKDATCNLDKDIGDLLDQIAQIKP